MSAREEALQEFWSQSEKDTWQTPDWLIELIEEFVTIDLDPCAGPNTNIGETNYWWPAYDGFEEEWFGTVFVNPPFSDKVDWIVRAIQQYKEGRVERVIILTPDSTDVQSWWHDLLAEHCDHVWFADGRVKFIDPETDEVAGSPTFGTALNFLGDFPDEMYESFAEEGDMVRRL